MLSQIYDPHNIHTSFLTVSVCDSKQEKLYKHSCLGFNATSHHKVLFTTIATPAYITTLCLHPSCTLSCHPSPRNSQTLQSRWVQSVKCQERESKNWFETEEEGIELKNGHWEEDVSVCLWVARTDWHLSCNHTGVWSSVHSGSLS